MKPRPLHLIPRVTRTPHGWLYVRWLRKLWLVAS